jgi:hypothetical protein
VVVGIDQVDAAPYLTPNKKQLMHITCHGKTTLIIYSALILQNEWFNYGVSVACRNTEKIK